MSAPEPRFTVVGSVLQLDSLPLANARIRLVWADTTSQGTAETAIDAETDDHGTFLVCGVVGGRAMHAVVTSTSGMTYTGRSSVPLVDYDELGRKRDSNLRKITIVVNEKR